jgi:hypothetical protein
MHIHGYLMGCDEAARRRGCDGMQRICVENGFELSEENLRIAMLDADGVRLVREIVGTGRRGKARLEAATDSCFACWSMGDEDPRARRLLALKPLDPPKVGDSNELSRDPRKVIAAQ